MVEIDAGIYQGDANPPAGGNALQTSYPQRLEARLQAQIRIVVRLQRGLLVTLYLEAVHLLNQRNLLVFLQIRHHLRQLQLPRHIIDDAAHAQCANRPLGDNL